MPRLHTSTNITAEVREDLRCGLTVREALQHGRQLTDRPDSWTEGYVRRIYDQLQSSNSIDSSRRDSRLTAIQRQFFTHQDSRLTAIQRQFFTHQSRQTVQQPTQSQVQDQSTSNQQPASNLSQNFDPPSSLDSNFYRRRTHQRRPRPMVEPTDEPEAARRAEAFEINTDNFDTHLTFGIEIEFLRPLAMSHSRLASKLVAAGIETHAESYNHDERNRDRNGNTTRNYWKIVTDGSVVSHLRDYEGHNEIVSPILKGINGLKQIEIVCRVLTENNIKVNKSCGLHVHHGCRNITGSIVDQIARNALVIYHKYQSKFNKMMPQSRRNNQYSRSFSSSELRTLRNGTLQCTRTRYKVINIESFWRHGTLEFRQHSGTIEFAKIINWIKITQSVVIQSKRLSDSNVDIWNYEFRKFETELNFSREIKNYIQNRITKFETVPVAAAA